MNYVICNIEQKAIFLTVISEINLSSSDVIFVSDNEQLHHIFSKPINPNGFVLIDVEANLGKQAVADYYGFDIAADLRRIYRVRNQIVFYSHTNSNKYFEDKSLSNIKFKLLFGRGSSFIEFPYTVELLKEKLLHTKPISRATLHDVVTMLCDLKGVVIDKLTHGLKFEKGAAYITQLFNDIEPYLSEEQKQWIEFSDFRDKMPQSIIKDNRTDFYNQKESFLKLCIRPGYLTQSKSIETEPAPKKHTVLLIDDRKEDLEVYATELSKDFIVQQTTSGEEAIKILKADSANNIKAIIADWRLFQDDTLTYWQPLQGYEVLEYAAQTGTRALFALTSQIDYVVHHIRNLLGVRFSMFKKDNLETPEQWKLFKDVLNDACEETTELIENIPRGTGWTKAEAGKKSLQQQYQEKRNSPDWLDFENQITESCNTIWEYYQSHIDRTLGEALQDFSKRFGIALKNNLESILIARRICIALFFNQGKIYQNILGNNYPRIDVYSIFRNISFGEFVEENRKETDKTPQKLEKEELDKKTGKKTVKILSVEEYTLSKMNTAASGLLNTTLCLEIEELASYGSMLPEERNWIVNKGFAIDLQYEKYTDDDENELENSNSNDDKEPTERDIRDLENNFRLEDSDMEDDD